MQGASQAPDTPRHGVSNGCRCTRTSLGAPLPLDSGWRSKDAKTRAQKCAAGTRKAVLKMVSSRPHPEERACGVGAADWNARTRVSKDEDKSWCALMLRDASQRSALWQVLRSRGAALLLSMRAVE